jgi:hypothetical protein
MRHTARSYFVEVVVPAHANFIVQYSKRELGLRKDTSAAASLAEALLHLPDHVFRDASTQVDKEFRSLRSYRESFWPQSFAYELICDFAIAWKHRHVSREGRKIDALEDVIETLVAVGYQDDEGIYCCTHKALFVKSTDNSGHDLSALLAQALELWMKELVSRGIIAVAPALPLLPPLFYSREQASQMSNMRLLGQKGEYLEIRQKLMVCDSKTRTVRLPTPSEEVQLVYKVDIDIGPSLFDIATKPQA